MALALKQVDLDPEKLPGLTPAQKIMIEQQRELAEVKSVLKALVTMQSGRALPGDRKR